MYFKNNKAQGAIEYLLIIGAAILIVAIVIIALTSLTGSGSTAIDEDQVSTTYNPLEELLANKKNQYFIPAGTTRYYEYNGVGTTLGQLSDSGENILVCYYANCSDDRGWVPVINGMTIQIITKKISGVVDQTDLVSLLEIKLEDWIDDEHGLKWSPSLGAYEDQSAENIRSICTNQGQNIRLPKKDELNNALINQFENNVDLGFLYNTDYWAIGDDDCVGLSRIWWAEETTINDCIANTTTTRGNVKCVYKE